MKKLIYLLTFLIILNNISSEDKIEQGIKEILDQNREVEVIIITEEGFNPYTIKKEQVYKNIDGFSTKTNEKEMIRLENSPKVKEIYLDKPFKITIEESKKIINSSYVNTLIINGKNLTGAEMGVCIIDTGIDYINPFFNNTNITGYNFVENNENFLDDSNNKHGTNIAGIIKGISPDVKLVIAKSCDSNGVCMESDIAAGIDYCISKKEEYNLTIISMSLGDGKEYNSETCPISSLDHFLNESLNQGIITVIASGNKGFLNGIEYPSCNPQVIPVGSTRKDDTLSSFTNRGELLDLLAPGEDINAAGITLSGTSMAVPHLAATITLLQQYKKEEVNQTLNFSYLKEVLKNTGKEISDLNKSYKRIDVSRALVEIDKKSPTITILSPTNTTYNTALIQIAYTTEDTNLNETYYLINNQTYNQSKILNLTDNAYILTLFSNDKNKNGQVQTISFSISTANKEKVSIVSPADYYITNKQELDLICNGENTNNLTLYINSQSIQTKNDALAVFSINLEEGKYFWYCKGAKEITPNQTIIIDKTPPTIILQDPDNNEEINSNFINLGFKPSENYDLEECDLSINNETIRTNKEIIKDAINTLSLNLANGNYTWRIDCIDKAGNEQQSESRLLTINYQLQESNEQQGSNRGSGSSGNGNPTLKQSNTKPINNPPISPITKKQYLENEIEKVNLKRSNQDSKKEEDKITGFAVTNKPRRTTIVSIIIISLALIISIIAIRIKKRDNKII